jgi:hypothetical protein
MSSKTPRRASTQPKRTQQSGDRRPSSGQTRTPSGGGTRGGQFGTSSTDQENHVHVPPELMPEIYGNEFMNTMLA